MGHVLQGCFKAILVDRDACLLALCRHVERNPVAAKMVSRAGEWPWSSSLAHVGQAAMPPWLGTDGLHAYPLGNRYRVVRSIARRWRRTRRRLRARRWGPRSCGQDLPLALTLT